MTPADAVSPTMPGDPAPPPSRAELEAALALVRDLSAQVDGGRTWHAIVTAVNTSTGSSEQHLRIIERDVQRVLSVVCTPPAMSSYLGDHLVFVPTSLGLPFIGFTDDLQITASLLLHRCWDAPTTHLLERILRPGDHFLDIGANLGYFTVFAATQVGHTGRVHAFEPNPRTYDLLCRNVRLNNVGHVCHLHQQALADRVDTRTLHTFIHNQGGSTLATLPERLLNEWHERPATRDVAATTLDDAFADSDERFSCIKMDAEGSENLIWTGGERFFRDHTTERTVVLLEWNPPALAGTGTNLADLMHRFGRHGFRVWRRDESRTPVPVRAVHELDAWCNTELILARDDKRLAEIYA